MRRLTLAILLGGCASAEPVPASYVETIPGTTVSFEMIYVDGFWIGKHEVTWDEYELFYLTRDEEGVDGVTRPSPPYEPPDRGWGRGRRPAFTMKRYAAEQYCAWLSKKTEKAYRLPTEAEWEKALGDGGEGWHAGNSGGTTQEVGQLKANARGIHDMVGNVWEWIDGTEEMVLRGGAWNVFEDECRTKRQAPQDRWSERDPQRPRSKWWFTDAPFAGFRVARS